MAAQYGMRTKNASGVVTLDTTVTSIRSIKTVEITGNGAWDQYFNIPEIKQGSFVVVQSPSPNGYSGVEAWWSVGRLHLRRAGSGRYSIKIMSYGDDSGSEVRYGVRARNDDSLVQIDNLNRVMSVIDHGAFAIGRRGPGDYIIKNGGTFKTPIRTIEQPYVFLTSDTMMMVCKYSLSGSPGNWTGFTVEGWFGGSFQTAYYVVKWMVGGYQASAADGEFGIRIRDESSQRIFSSSDNLLLLNGTPSADRFKVSGSDVVVGPTLWSSYRMAWTGSYDDYFLASSLISPFTDGYNFFDNPAGFFSGNRSILQAYSGSQISSTNAAGVNGRTLFAGRPMRPL